MKGCPKKSVTGDNNLKMGRCPFISVTPSTSGKSKDAFKAGPIKADGRCVVPTSSFTKLRVQHKMQHFFRVGSSCVFGNTRLTCCGGAF
ncbi:hypothetical protein CEXT_443321 [Caerostris extrusa]|uniref:Uncharacterized protein n=1 Tax=Caerostris extrusa TaxID=172846 RepID=A0AAV4RMQ5_CAEEX|nr:hypothetical protein CEXT_443321 [Caerostris extrusa]